MYSPNEPVPILSRLFYLLNPIHWFKCIFLLFLIFPSRIRTENECGSIRIRIHSPIKISSTLLDFLAKFTINEGFCTSSSVFSNTMQPLINRLEIVWLIDWLVYTYCMSGSSGWTCWLARAISVTTVSPSPSKCARPPSSRPVILPFLLTIIDYIILGCRGLCFAVLRCRN